MAGKLTKEKLTELKEAFKDFDKDGSGTISAVEFRSFMKKQAHAHDENISDIEIDIQVNLFQKLTTSAEHVAYQNCSECQNKTKQKQQFVYTTCSVGILSLQFS